MNSVGCNKTPRELKEGSEAKAHDIDLRCNKTPRELKDYEAVAWAAQGVGLQ